MSHPFRPAESAAAGGAPDVTRKILPERYLLRERDGGRVLTCLEAPNVAVTVRRGAAVSAAAARRAEPGTIFLDGAAAAEPFLDAARRVYNLDHHEGCVRAFTLSSCEQAMVLVRKGLDLKGGDWTVVANEPDLDTVLAIWVLLNHMRLNNDDGAVRRAILPLLRLEGTIDVHGLELKDLAALPQEAEDEAMRWMERVRQEEVALKRSGAWAETDPLEYTARALGAVDALVYSPRDFTEVPDVEEVLRMPIGRDRTAILCRTDAGIYEVEQHLRRLHGDRVGLIVLQTGPATFTLRQTDPFLPVHLEAVYERLNLLDPAVTGADAGNRWGGSADIGGSPRASGSALAGGEVVRVAADAYRPVSAARRVRALAFAVGAAVLGVALPLLAVRTPSWPPALAIGALGPVRQVLLAPLLLGAAAVLFVLLARRAPRRFGATAPEGWRWMAALPVMLLGAWGGGAFLPPAVEDLSLPWLLLALAAPVGAELLFRGVCHGLLVTVYPAAGDVLPPSVPTVAAAVLGAAATTALLRASPGLVTAAATFAGALLLGIAAGIARERAGSVAAPIVLHLVAVLLLIGAGLLA